MKFRFKLFSGISIFMSIVYLFKAFDKIDSNLIKTENKFVGGDAYNYIINGTHSTSYMVLFATFLIAGLLFLAIGYLESMAKKDIKVEEIKNTTSSNISDDKVEITENSDEHKIEEISNLEISDKK